MAGRKLWVLALVAVAACDPQMRDEPVEPQQLTVMAAIPPGDDCEIGGTRTDTGVDDDGSGTLEPAEVDSTSLVCTEPVVHHGDVVITTAEQAAALDGVDEIDGSLRLQGASPPLNLPRIVRVRGDFSCYSGAAVGFDMPNLEIVDGSFTVSGSWPATPRLARVGGDALISAYVDPRPLLPALRSIGGDLHIGMQSFMSIYSFELRALTDLGGGLVISGRMAFSAPGITRASYVRSTRNTENMSTVTAIRLAALATVDQDISLTYTSLTELELPALVAASTIAIYGNEMLCNSIAQALVTRTGVSDARIANKDC